MISSGLRAVVTCVDPQQLPLSFAGREFNQQFLADLPDHVDPCGERGEFHTFAFDGPMFEKPVGVKMGAVVERDGFGYADFLLVAQYRVWKDRFDGTEPLFPGSAGSALSHLGEGWGKGLKRIKHPPFASSLTARNLLGLALCQALTRHHNPLPKGEGIRECSKPITSLFAMTIAARLKAFHCALSRAK